VEVVNDRKDVEVIDDRKVEEVEVMNDERKEVIVIVDWIEGEQVQLITIHSLK
jgi:hypothetical protein